MKKEIDWEKELFVSGRFNDKFQRIFSLSYDKTYFPLEESKQFKRLIK